MDVQDSGQRHMDVMEQRVTQHDALPKVQTPAEAARLIGEIRRLLMSSGMTIMSHSEQNRG